MRGWPVLLLLAGCGEPGPKASLLSAPGDLAMILKLVAPGERDAYDSPQSPRPPGPGPRPPSLYLIPGPPVPWAPEPGWVHEYQFSRAEAEAVVEVLANDGHLVRAFRHPQAPPVPSGRSYRLVIGPYNSSSGTFFGDRQWTVDLGWGPGLTAALRRIQGALKGERAAAVVNVLQALK